MQFDDLTPYKYGVSRAVDWVKNIGWLSVDHPFARGPVDSRVPDALEQYYEQLEANRTRGLHPCPFCPGREDDPAIVVNGRLAWLGAGELWVPGPGGIVFAAPDLVIHYMRDHSYLPPSAFIGAVLALPTRLENWDPEAVLRRIEAG